MERDSIECRGYRGRYNPVSSWSATRRSLPRRLDYCNYSSSSSSSDEAVDADSASPSPPPWWWSRPTGIERCWVEGRGEVAGRLDSESTTTTDRSAVVTTKLTRNSSVCQRRCFTAFINMPLPASEIIASRVITLYSIVSRH